MHEQPFNEAVFTHASTSPNLQIIASLDVARRQMELEGYDLVMRAIELAIEIRRGVNSHPLISKYFRVLTAEEMIPAEFRQSGFKDFLEPGMTWAGTLKAFREDEFVLDPTRLTLVCGTAGFDGTQFKNLLAAEYEIQLNKTSRNSHPAADQHQQHPQRRRQPAARCWSKFPRGSRRGSQRAARKRGALSRRASSR